MARPLETHFQVERCSEGHCPEERLAAAPLPSPLAGGGAFPGAPRARPSWGCLSPWEQAPHLRISGRSGEAPSPSRTYPLPSSRNGNSELGTVRATHIHSCSRKRSRPGSSFQLDPQGTRCSGELEKPGQRRGSCTSVLRRLESPFLWLRGPVLL